MNAAATAQQYFVYVHGGCGEEWDWGGGLISATAPAIHCGKTGIHLDVISSSMRGGE